MKKVFYVAAALLLLGVLPMPIGYYTLLRIVVFLVGAVSVVGIYKAWGMNAWCITFGLMTILFNPIWPIYLPKGAWAFIDAAAAVFFIIGATKLKR